MPQYDSPTLGTATSVGATDKILLWITSLAGNQIMTLKNFAESIKELIGYSSKPAVFATLVELTAYEVDDLVTNDSAFIYGYNSANDGGGGWFRYNKTSIAAVNGGTIIAPNVGSGRWLRVNKSTLSVKDFGAFGDGATDDTSAIQSAITTAAGGSLYIPAGTYITSGALVSISGLSIIGDGMGISTLKAKNNAASLYVIKLRNQITSISISSLTLDGNRANAGTAAPALTAQGALYVDASQVNVSHVELKNSADSGAFVGSVTTAPDRISFDQCYIHNNGGVLNGTDNGHGVTLGVGLTLRPTNVRITNNNFVDNHNTITSANDSCAILSAAQFLVITGNTFKNNYNIGGGQVVLYSDVTGSGANRVDAVVSNNFFTLTSHVVATDVTGGVEINGYGYAITGNLLENPQGDLVGSQHAFQTDAGGVGDVLILGNTVHGYDVGFAQLGDGTHIVFAQNLVNNNAGAIRYGAALRAGSVDVMITGNDFTACLNGIPGTASTTTVVSGNTLPSYPVPSILTVGASPHTYTSGATKEVISVGGGTVSAVAVGGHTLFFGTGCSVTLPPHTAITVTYTVAPQMIASFIQ